MIAGCISWKIHSNAPVQDQDIIPEHSRSRKWNRIHLKGDCRGAVEEIGFIYVLALSVLLWTAIFFTIEDSTSSQKEQASKTFLDGTSEMIAGVVQDVINQQIIIPDVNLSKTLELSHPQETYQYRIEFSQSAVWCISRVKNIRVSSPLYNPMEIHIDTTITGDAGGLEIRYISLNHTLVINVVDFE